MDQKDILENLVEIEQELNLFENDICGIHFWKYIRYTVFNELMDQSDRDETNEYDSNTVPMFVQYLSGILRNTVVKNPFLTGNKEAVFLGHPRRKFYDDGYWWDIYCDPVIDHLDIDTVYLEIPYSKKHFSPAKTANLKYLDLIIYSSPFAWRILDTLNPLSFSESESKMLDSLDKEINNRFNIDLNVENIVTKTLLARRYQVPLYEQILKQIDPEIAITVVGHNRENFLEACKNLGIISVDLQHGTMNGHPGYSYPEDQHKQVFADYLLIWGEFWGNNVEFPIPDDRVIPVGYPHLEQSARQYENTRSREQILFISQGTIGEQLSKFAMEVDRHPDIDHGIVYKLHPGEYDRWRDEYPWLADADFEIVDSSEPPLYELFAKSSVQIGVYSTAVYEGLAFDLETFVYDCPGAETLDPLIEEGSATLISSADELASGLGSGNRFFDNEYYFAPNATERTCAVLERLAKEGTPHLTDF